MRAFVIIPVKRFENSKTRLSSILGAGERAQLAGLMLQDTLAALEPLKLDTVIVSADSRAREAAEKHGAQFIQEENDSGVNSAVALADRYCIEAGADATIVVPEDLPLLSAHDVKDIIHIADKDSNCIVVCPSARYDGTNILLRRPPNVIRTHYDNNSYEMHVKTARETGIAVHVATIERLMFDIDTPQDVASLAKRDSVSARATREFLLRRAV